MKKTDPQWDNPITSWRTPRLSAACDRIRDVVRTLDYAGSLLRVQGLNVSPMPPRTLVRPHRHSHHELVWILRGRGRSLVHPVGSLLPGTVQLHPPGELHAWENGAWNMLRIGLAFSLDPCIRPPPPEAWPRPPGIREELGVLLAEAADERPGQAERLRARLTLLLAPLLDPLIPPRQRPPRHQREDPGPDLATQVDRFLADNLEQNLSLADMALQMQVSVPTLTRRYRAECDCTIMQTLQRLRLETAERLLAHDDLSVAEVATRVGFSDCSYFCRCFRALHGRTPGSLRSAP